MRFRHRTLRDFRTPRNAYLGARQDFSFFDRYRHYMHPFVIYFFLCLVLLCASVLSDTPGNGRYYLIVLFGILGVLLISRIRVEMAVKKLKFRHRPLKKFFREGDEVEVIIEVENHSSTAIRSLLIQDSFQPASESHIRIPVFILDAYSRVKKRYRAKCDSGMGRKKIGPLRFSITDVTGVFEYDLEGDDSCEVDILPDIPSIPVLPVTPAQDSHQFGIYEISNRGSSVSLAGIRNYNSGDSPRHISWRLSTRGRGLVVKDFEKSVNAMVYIVLNLEPFWQFGKGADSTWEYAKDVALAIASQHSQLGNFVGLMSGNTILPPGVGQSHISEIASRIARLNLSSVFTEKSALLLDSSEMKFGSLAMYEGLFHAGSEVYYIVPFNEREFQASERSIRRVAVAGYHLNIVFIDVGAFWRKHADSIPTSQLLAIDLFKRFPEITKSLRKQGVRVFVVSTDSPMSKSFQTTENPS
jgi:uncharacterized protein (DUF58 family)